MRIRKTIEWVFAEAKKWHHLGRARYGGRLWVAFPALMTFLPDQCEATGGRGRGRSGMAGGPEEENRTGTASGAPLGGRSGTLDPCPDNARRPVASTLAPEAREAGAPQARSDRPGSALVSTGRLRRVLTWWHDPVLWLYATPALWEALALWALLL